ncbi:D-2-hydroxyacid dehydrogenase [Bacillus sp. REN10]|uniref:D-2-hydroxyacid dehydrogenase n=1 Tax=Bacillus sp. REN10 TaxID=2782541 RepID=UPI00193AFA81|nr:D-2-hydroxyacid dehydrogenase [Bacillus sp. REN10]
MKTVFTFRPPRKLQAQLIENYPSIEFIFYKTVEEAEELIHAEIIVTFGEDLTPQHIEECKQLKWVMVASAGLEKMPFASFKDKDILVTNARGVHKIPMAEFTLGYLLNHVKRFPELRKLQGEAIWNKRLPISELADQTLLVLGTGAIGSEIARLADAFRIKTIGINRSGRAVDYFAAVYPIDQLLTVLPEADFVVSILPSTNETKHLLKKEHFQAMKNTAAFINIGRGDVLEEKVLIEALNKEEIAHAYLDVFEQEPLPEEHAFWSHENITVTPHISSITPQYLPRVFEIFEYNLERYLQGSDVYKNRVDINRGY